MGGRVKVWNKGVGLRIWKRGKVRGRAKAEELGMGKGGTV